MGLEVRQTASSHIITLISNSNANKERSTMEIAHFSRTYFPLEMKLLSFP